MKACVLEAVNKLEYKDVPTPAPAAGEVLLRIKASGICSRLQAIPIVLMIPTP